MKNIKLSIALSLIVISANTNAQVYRCEGPDGRMSFQPRPCNGAESEKVEIYVAPAPSDITQQENIQSESNYWDKQREDRLEREARAIERSRVIREEREKQERFKLMMMRNQIGIGMTEDQVRRSWGSPCRTSRTIRENSTFVQWVYCRDNVRDDYVYFSNGIVSSISR